MRIAEAYGPNKFALSFELFPPKTPAGDEELDRHLAELMRFEPSFVTCTYGAAGSTRDKTLEVVSRVHVRYGTTVAAHLTCVGSSRDDLRDYLREAQARGVENIVALRGDPPRGEKVFRPAADGLRYANELVALLRAEFPQFGIAVAGYPETHQEAPSPEVDLENLARKVAAGADVVIAQLFYQNADFFRFRDKCAAQKIQVPIVPGVLPITNLAQIRRITDLCGAKLPASLVANLEACGDSTDAQFEVGVDFATRQVQELLDAGVPGLHFYVLNRSAATVRVLGNVRHSARAGC
ncbi:MAG: methylenetetrahydrofolate reductase [NAD(P)H] [Pirellulales bacterium]|nr:methylenetetrahydrofolate reductase [NAD(P)H] [Pirellulales bacterium]